MSWVAVAVGGSALLSYAGAKDKQQQEKAGMLANAEQIRNSPWTGMAANVHTASAQNPVLAGLGGGLQGGVTAATLKQGMNRVDQENKLSELQQQKLEQELAGQTPGIGSGVSLDELRKYQMMNSIA